MDVPVYAIGRYFDWVEWERWCWRTGGWNGVVYFWTSPFLVCNHGWEDKSFWHQNGLKHPPMSMNRTRWPMMRSTVTLHPADLLNKKRCMCYRLIPRRFTVLSIHSYHIWDAKNRHEMTQRSFREVDTRSVALRWEPSGPKSVAVPDVADIDQDRVEAVDAAR